ncbi:hypothetical protein ACFWBI_18185 [Streptomyces sp. NPDC059982]|uniref:hypothetical protein n=1 Tax=unclassified Streptomyces TaxID=2593676 RepID=UPI003681DAC4
MDEDRDSRRRAWCVALVLRHAPQHIAADLLRRLDPATRDHLCRDERLPACAVTLLVRDGTDRDRHFVARNPYVRGRPLPGLPGPARYAARRTPDALLPLLRARLGRDPADAPLSTRELIALLRAHGTHHPRVPLDILALAAAPDPEELAAAHLRRPLPPGAVEALLMRGELPQETVRALLETAGTDAYGRNWHRPAVRAVRMGLLTPAELAGCLAPAHRTLLLCRPTGIRGLRWNLSEEAELRAAAARELAPLGDDPRLWAELLRQAPAFPGTLGALADGVAHGALPAPPPGPPVPGLAEAVRAMAPAPVEPVGDVERELALASLAVPMETVEEDIRWVRDCLDRGLLTGTDVIRHKLPACWALDEDHWLGDVDHPDRYDRPEAVLAARAEAGRLFALALGQDAQAWWRVARTLPDFAGTLPHLLLRVTDGDSVSKRP